MKEEIISFKTAKLAKEKGLPQTAKDFEQVFMGWYNEEGDYLGQTQKGGFLAISQSLLQKWLREKHEIHIVVNSYWIRNGKYEYEATTYSNLIEEDYDRDETFDTFEEALEDGLLDALNLIEP